MALSPAQLAALAVTHVGLDDTPKKKFMVRRKSGGQGQGNPRSRGKIPVPAKPSPKPKPAPKVVGPERWECEQRGKYWWVRVVSKYPDQKANEWWEREVFLLFDDYDEDEAILEARRACGHDVKRSAKGPGGNRNRSQLRARIARRG